MTAHDTNSSEHHVFHKLLHDWAGSIVANDAEQIAAFHAQEWVSEIFIRRDGRWHCQLSVLIPDLGRTSA